MHLIDIAGGISAHRHSRSQVVTVAVDSLDFLYPIRVGELVVLRAHITRAFRTSMEVEVKVYREDYLTGQRQQTNSAFVTYVALDPKDYVPLIIIGTPEMKSDGQGKSVLTVCLARRNAKRAEAFTRAHLGGRIAMVVDGEIVTLHKIRSVITAGKVQVTRCTDNACEVIRSKLVK